jgi:two-component system nitrate/nitrite response regulator NarL
MDNVRTSTSAFIDGPTHVGQGPDSSGELDVASPRKLLILSDIRFLREGLATVLTRDRGFAIVGVANDLAEALPLVTARPRPVILIDAGLPDGLAVVSRLRRLDGLVQIVAFALHETEAEVIAWAEAGVCGYLPRSAALDELADCLDKIMHSEQTCSTRVAAGLLRRLAESPRTVSAKTAGVEEVAALTAREDQVAGLIAAGLSNKEIARRLQIGVATVKSHVHNILSKLTLERRSQLVRWARGVSPLFDNALRNGHAGGGSAAR